MAGLFSALNDLFGHDLQLQQRAYGKTRHYWVECSCGYESGRGRSYKFAVSSGIGHAKRVADRVSREHGLEEADAPEQKNVPEKPSAATLRHQWT